MKTPALLLALLLGGATALRAQPTNREYNRLQNATNRAYSVPDRPAPRSTRAERSYTPSSSSGPNTPSSGGMQVVVPTNSNLFGKTYESAEEKEAGRERRAQIAAGMAANAEAKKREEDRQDLAVWNYGRKEMYEATGTWTALGYDVDDAGRLGGLSRTRMGAKQFYSEKDLQKFEQAQRARRALQTKLEQPGASFDELRKLLAAEWGILEKGVSFGTNTALRDMETMQRLFPAELHLLNTDRLHLKVAELGILSTGDLERSRMEERFYAALREVQRFLPTRRAPITLDLQAVACGAAINLQACQPEDESGRKSVAAMAQLLYTTCKDALANTPNDRMLTAALPLCADVLLAAEARDQRHDPAHQEWVALHDGPRWESRLAVAELESSGDDKKKELAQYIIEAPANLLQMSEFQWMKLCLVFRAGYADNRDQWAKREQFARMLQYSNAVPENREWEALKNDQPISKLILAVATAANDDNGKSLLGTLTHGRGKWSDARDLWRAATSPAHADLQLTAMRNLYRAYRTNECDDCDKDDWQRLMGKGEKDTPEMLYNQALILLDQHPAYPRIGKRGGKANQMALEQLTAAAAAGYEPAQAKLKEL